jgi:hypothetical protein
MDPFSWPVIGRLWLQSARTPMFYVLIKTYGTRNINRAEADAYGKLLLGPDADERSSRSCGASNGPPPLSTPSRPL